MNGRFRAGIANERSQTFPWVSSPSPRTGVLYGRFRAGVGQRSQTSSSSRRARSISASSVDTELRQDQSVFLTYSRCSIESKDEFEEAFRDMLQKNRLPFAKYYACREYHESEGVRFHVLVNVGKQPNWSSKYVRSAFLLEGNECDPANIFTPRSRKGVCPIIQNYLNYFEKVKGGDCFGERPMSSG